MSKNTKSVKELRPKDPDTKHYGNEPEFPVQPDADQRISAVGRALKWYDLFYGRKDAREALAGYLDYHERITEARAVRKVADSDIITSYAWLSRISLRGLALTDTEAATLENEISRLVKASNAPKSDSLQRKEDAAAAEVARRPNIQELMRERAREANGEIEGMFDDYILQGAKSKHDFKPMDELKKMNVMAQQIAIITAGWKRKIEEFEEVLKGESLQHEEAYSQYTKTQIKNMIKFCEFVIADLQGYVGIKKASQAPRKKRAVSPEKVVAKLKYLREFEDPAIKLKLESVKPTALIGASEAWVYDTAKRRLHHYVADAYAKEFTVKGNTLIGFDTTKSEIKTLRKPAEQIKAVMGSKPAARTFFKEIKAVATAPNGRFNENLIILKAW